MWAGTAADSIKMRRIVCTKVDKKDMNNTDSSSSNTILGFKRLELEHIIEFYTDC